MAQTAMPQAIPAAPETDVDTLGFLEERIHRTVALVNRLRQEKESALSELASARELNMRLTGEVESLQAERLQVRNRLEKLLGHIDQLGSA